MQSQIQIGGSRLFNAPIMQNCHPREANICQLVSQYGEPHIFSHCNAPPVAVWIILAVVALACCVCACFGLRAFLFGDAADRRRRRRARRAEKRANKEAKERLKDDDEDEDGEQC